MHVPSYPQLAQATQVPATTGTLVIPLHKFTCPHSFGHNKEQTFQICEVVITVKVIIGNVITRRPLISRPLTSHNQHNILHLSPGQL